MTHALKATPARIDCSTGMREMHSDVPFSVPAIWQATPNPSLASAA